MIALYKGTSAFSRLIRLRTWSQYSHASWLDDATMSETEAWHKGVTQSDVPFENHTPGTVVDLFHVNLGDDQTHQLSAFLRRQIGKPYDWPAVLGFVTHRPQSDLPAIMRADAQAKWFCSELIFAALAAVDSAPLARIKQWQVYPGLLAYSPMLTYLRSAVVPDYKQLSGTQELKKSDPDFLSSKLEVPLGI